MKILKVSLLFLLAWSASAENVLKVGPKGKYKAPCAAIAAAKAGDTVEIDAGGQYVGDVCAFSTSRLTLRGVNGRAKLDAGGAIAQGKAIWVIAGEGVVVENIEFTGAKCENKNGAGIRREGSGSLVVRNCVFRNNEDGILTDHNPKSTLLVEYSEFDHNGHGDGYSHNMYIGGLGEFTLRYSYSHDTLEGHLVKSRALKNRILYNRLTTEWSNTSYELDLPNGGDVEVIGNVIGQSASSSNSGMMTYGVEKPGSAQAGGRLVVAHNTFVNAKQMPTMFIAVKGDAPVEIHNNIFSGDGTLTDAENVVMGGNMVVPDSGFVNAAGWDMHLKASSLAIDGGVELQSERQPKLEYKHPGCVAKREAVGRPDSGAFEYGGEKPAGPEVNLPERCR
ncbi:MAG: hypothetical protein HY821_08220 [Acidobacteria bacterium]|nr:hypothetical protein [Acidobacteriota bacterium]